MCAPTEKRIHEIGRIEHPQGVIPFGWVGAPAEEKNTQSWKDRAHEAGGYIVRRLAPRRAGGENERIVNCAPKQHKAEKSVDRHRLFVIYLKNTK